MKFFYQLKVKDQSNIVEKISKKSRENKEIIDFRIFITELTPEWEVHWLTKRDCKICAKPYTLIQLKQLNIYGGNNDVCSIECRHLQKPKEASDNYAISYINQSFKPCVYKITNKETNKCYIGQTIQCFTLRWYQHFFQTGDTKFHLAIKDSSPSNWSFEVIEVLNQEKISKKEIDEREMFWINHYDSINNGYNTKKTNS